MTIIRKGPPEDPFDHSHCYHPRPRWVIEISPSFHVDLFELLHMMWRHLQYGQVKPVLELMDQFNHYLAASALGQQDQIEEQIKGGKRLVEELRILRDESAFEDELKRLYEQGGDETNGIDGTEG